MEADMPDILHPASCDTGISDWRGRRLAEASQQV